MNLILILGVFGQLGMDEVLFVLARYHADAVFEGSDLLTNLHASVFSGSTSIFLQANLLLFQAPRRAVVILGLSLGLLPRCGFFLTDIVAEFA